MTYFFPHTIFFAIGSALGAVVAAFGWRQRHKMGGGFFLALMLACVEWTGAAAVESVVVGTSAKVLWSKIEYIGLSYVGVFFLLFVLAYTHQMGLIQRGGRFLLGLIPTLSLVFVWTNDWHHLQWTGFSQGSPTENVLVYHRGPVFWFIIAYTYFFMACAYGLLIQIYFRSTEKAIRRQYLGFMAGGIFPLVTGLIYLFGQKWVGGMDVAPLGFSVTAFFIAWVLFRFRLLDLVPIGRAVLVEQVPDGVMVLDNKDRLVDVNPAARRLLDVESAFFDSQRLMKRYPALKPLISSMEGGQVDMPLLDGLREVSVRMVPLFGKKGNLQGRLFILHDITDRVQAVRDREHMIDELNQALNQIRTLRGLLPICCACKRIRNDEGYWQQLESYMCEHTGFEFSHGLCPECEKKLYAESGVIPQPSQPDAWP